MNYGSIPRKMESVPSSSNNKLKVSASVFAAILTAALISYQGSAGKIYLFQDPNDSSLDATSWTLTGLLGDGIDGDSAQNPFKLKDDAPLERNGPFLRDLPKQFVSGAQNTRDIFFVKKAQMLLQIHRPTTSLLGGDDWLGAPFAVPEDVRENGEQEIGEEVNYWNTHSGDIGTGTKGYPY